MTAGDFVRSMVAKPWGWNDWDAPDCCVYIARWCIERGNDNPMNFTQDLYHDENSAYRLIVRHGGLVPLWTRGMIDAQIPEADEPILGDVGVIEAITEDGLNEACGIYLGDKWAVRTPNGMLFSPAVPLQIWRP